MRIRFVAIALAVITATVQGVARGATYESGYELHELANSNTPSTSNITSIALNNHGEVAFLAYEFESYQQSVFTVSLDSGPSVLYGPSLTRPNGQNLNISSSELDINDHGEVVFGAQTFLESSGIYSGDGGSITEHTFNSNAFLGGASINNLGNVAYWGYVSDSPGIYQSDGTTVNMIDPLGDPIFAEINESNEVAFSSYSFSADRIAIYDGDGQVLVEEGDSISNLYIGRPTWNGEGTLLYSAQTESGTGLFTINNDVTTQIASGFITRAAINEAGDIAYIAAGAMYFYSSTSGDVITVVSLGDTISDKIVSSLFFSPHGFSDSREIAFGIVFSNGEVGVYLAQPVPVPGAFWLLFSSVVLLGKWRKK